MKRAGGSPDAPRASKKRATLALDESQRERVRGSIRTLFECYESLIAAPDNGGDEAAFQALLDAAQGARRFLRVLAASVCWRRRRRFCAAAAAARYAASLAPSLSFLSLP